ncbi:MAG TPA: ferrochelatase [Candidatus Sulfotelmatobacter sp.]|nr:ferrochelatase [Candidatus Sulfotelmatobacter sp.]
MPGNRLAVVLFNLGGPDSPAAVRPFLQNLFSDPAIIGLPQPFRGLLARLIAHRRAPVARAIYAKIGGASPLLPLTQQQASALQGALTATGTVRVFVAMRYWHPRAAATAREVAAFAPDRIVLLPLYPQFSTTTSASSLADWHRAAAHAGIAAPTHAVCCYPGETGLATAQAALLRQGLAEAAAHGTPRVLFSAHGLPQKIVDGGDPYAWQVQQTAAAVVAALGIAGLDWRICYQSRVGPLKWLQPSIDTEIARAAADRVPLVVVPIAFVSEHSETLVELDIDYRHRAAALGVPAYVRVPAVGTEAGFIAGLARLVQQALERPGIGSGSGGRLCPAACARCALA